MLVKRTNEATKRESQSAGFSTHSCQTAPTADWVMVVLRTETRQEQIGAAAPSLPQGPTHPGVSAAAEGRCPPSWDLPMSPLSSGQLSCTLRPKLSLLAPVGFSPALSVISKGFLFFFGGYILYRADFKSKSEDILSPSFSPERQGV